MQDSTGDIPAVTFPTDADESLSNLPAPHSWQTVHQDRLVALSLANKVNTLLCHGNTNTISYYMYTGGYVKRARLVLEHTVGS